MLYLCAAKNTCCLFHVTPVNLSKCSQFGLEGEQFLHPAVANLVSALGDIFHHCNDLVMWSSR